MTWWQYVRRVAGGQQKDVAERTQLTQSTISRWKTTGRAGDPANVAAFARAYGRPVLEAFVEAGFLSDEEARAKVTRTDTALVDDDELVGEVARRLRERSATPTVGTGIDAAGDADEDGRARLLPSELSVADQVNESSRQAFSEAPEDTTRR